MCFSDEDLYGETRMWCLLGYAPSIEPLVESFKWLLEHRNLVLGSVLVWYLEHGTWESFLFSNWASLHGLSRGEDAPSGQGFTAASFLVIIHLLGGLNIIYDISSVFGALSLDDSYNNWSSSLMINPMELTLVTPRATPFSLPSLFSLQGVSCGAVAQSNVPDFMLLTNPTPLGYSYW